MWKGPIDVNPLFDRIKAAKRLTSERALGRFLGISHTHVAYLRDGGRPSVAELENILVAAGEDPTMPVLNFMKSMQPKRVAAIIDKAIKALSAASLVALVTLAFSIASAPTAQANAGPRTYTLCDN